MIVHLNYLSDFIIKERFKTSSGDMIAIPDECDFTLTYRTSPYAEHIASRINGVYTNCAPTNGGALLVMFNEHGLDRGSLTRTAEFDFRNSVVPDGFLSIVSPESTSIELWAHESEIHGVVDCDALLNYVKGDVGKPPVFEPGTIESGNPDTAPILRLVFTGHNADGNPLYTITGSLPKGDGFRIAGYYETLDELMAAYPTGDAGMYIVGDGDLYGWDTALAAWEFAGHIKGEKGDTGFTPVIEVGDIATGAAGSAASLTLTPSGVDANGNPIYKLGGSIPRGSAGGDGKTPVFEVGDILTGEPGTEAQLTLSPNGVAPDGSPRYLLSATLPRGDKGAAGETEDGEWMEPASVSASWGDIGYFRYKKIGNGLVLFDFALDTLGHNPPSGTSANIVLIEFTTSDGSLILKRNVQTWSIMGDSMYERAFLVAGGTNSLHFLTLDGNPMNGAIIQGIMSIPSGF